MQLAQLYRMAFPVKHGQYFGQLINLSSRSGTAESITDAALSFFTRIEEECFPLEHMWEWHDSLNDYGENIKPWLYDIPVKVIGLDWGLEPKNMNEPQGLLMRLASVGNYSKQAEKHKQVLMFEHPEWEWDGLLNTFKLSHIIPILEEMILPPPFNKLPALVKYVTHETDTYFLDYTIEDWPHHIQWSEKSFNWLKKDWQVALQIKNQADELTDWLIENRSQLRKVWMILKIAHHRSLDS